MTHLYTILVRGTVLPGRDQPAVSAIAWAAGTVLALGSDEEMRGLSRGDSHVVDLAGASVVPLGAGADAVWPPDTRLEIGGRADLAILASDPRLQRRAAEGSSTVAVIRGGCVVAGQLPTRTGGWARRRPPAGTAGRPVEGVLAEPSSTKEGTQ